MPETAPIGVSPRHTSEPRDARLALDPTATAHLVVGPTGDEAVECLLSEGSAVAAVVEPLLLGVQARDVPGLLAALDDALARATVGVRVYAAGSEALVRDVTHHARAAGLSDAEIVSAVTGTRARRIWCVHCSEITDGVTTSTAPCAGCGRTLIAYHHYSRRRNAYLGFQADAELPGDLPEPEPLWP
ncbi:MAG: hypothetical protein JHC95_18645 [Solirubrobacteraceae bacterium]|nr:hypothetical protein [Solirubrobacteraceae bacterium]